MPKRIHRKFSSLELIMSFSGYLFLGQSGIKFRQKPYAVAPESIYPEAKNIFIAIF